MAKPERVQLKVDRLEADVSNTTSAELLAEIEAIINAEYPESKSGNPSNEYKVELRRLSRKC